MLGHLTEDLWMRLVSASWCQWTAKITTVILTFMGPCILIIFWYISNKMWRYTVYFICKLLYMFRVLPSPIIRSANNCIYSIWYLSRLYCYLLLLWKIWNWFECAVGGVRKTIFGFSVVKMTVTWSLSSTVMVTQKSRMHGAAYFIKIICCDSE